MQEIGFLFGAASGIGKATYQKIRNTYPELKLIILDKSPVDLLNKKDEFYQLDLSDFENAKKFIKLKINNQKLVVKFIINTIGYQENVTIDNIDYMQWDKMYNATVKSIFFIEREIIKLIKDCIFVKNDLGYSNLYRVGENTLNIKKLIRNIKKVKKYCIKNNINLGIEGMYADISEVSGYDYSKKTIEMMSELIDELI